MILNRLGNKRRLAAKILRYFPPHDLYIEPFFGAGGMFFSKPKAKYNIVNDFDAEVYNLFRVLSDQREALRRGVWEFPVHEDLWNYWKAHKETEPVMRAVRFLFLSNFGYLGKPTTLRFNSKNTKRLICQRIDPTAEMIFGVEFANRDFREFLTSIPLNGSDKRRTFVYADPPYLSTANNYEPGGFQPKDFVDLIEVLTGLNVKFIVSEFDHPFVLETARKNGLKIVEIGERIALKAVKKEIILRSF